MTDEHALLAAMAADPADDTVRLAYADLLEEKGEAERAEFVRVQVELDRVPLNGPDRHALVVRHVRLLRECVPGWRAELPRLPGVEWGDFRRGLVEEVQAEAEEAVVRHAKAIFAQPAVHVIRLRRLVSGKRLAAVPELSRVRALRMVSAGAGADALLVLFDSPYWDRVLTLDLHGNRIDDAVVENLADGRFPELAELWLGACPVGDAGGRALASSAHLGGLRLLDLRGTLIRDRSVAAALRRRFGKSVSL